MKNGILMVVLTLMATFILHAEDFSLLCVKPKKNWGWQVSGTGVLASTYSDEKEVTIEVDWTKSADWGIGAKFDFDETVDMTMYPSITFEVMSNQPEKAALVYVAIYNKDGEAVSILKAKYQPLTAKWEAVAYQERDFKSYMKRPFTDEDKKSIAGIKICFTNPDAKIGAGTEKVSFRNVVIK